MREVVDHLRASGIKTYIVTAGGQDSVRAYAQKVYGSHPSVLMPPSETPRVIAKCWNGSARATAHGLKMLVHRDYAQREYACGPAGGFPNTKVGTFDESLMDEAEAKGWTVISMKNDWK